jgi:hypothetical protein
MARPANENEKLNAASSTRTRRLPAAGSAKEGKRVHRHPTSSYGAAKTRARLVRHSLGDGGSSRATVGGSHPFRSDSSPPRLNVFHLRRVFPNEVEPIAGASSGVCSLFSTAKASGKPGAFAVQWEALAAGFSGSLHMTTNFLNEFRTAASLLVQESLHSQA